MEERSWQDAKKQNALIYLQTNIWNRILWEQHQTAVIIVGELINSVDRILVASSD